MGIYSVKDYYEDDLFKMKIDFSSQAESKIFFQQLINRQIYSDILCDYNIFDMKGYYGFEEL